MTGVDFHSELLRKADLMIGFFRFCSGGFGANCEQKGQAFDWTTHRNHPHRFGGNVGAKIRAKTAKSAGEAWGKF